MGKYFLGDTRRYWVSFTIKEKTAVKSYSSSTATATVKTTVSDKHRAPTGPCLAHSGENKNRTAALERLGDSSLYLSSLGSDRPKEICIHKDVHRQDQMRGLLSAGEWVAGMARTERRNVDRQKGVSEARCVKTLNTLLNDTKGYSDSTLGQHMQNKQYAAKAGGISFLWWKYLKLEGGILYNIIY